MPPIEFSSIGLNREKFKKSDSKSWRGPCPRCGGNRRFVVFTDHEFPLWHGFCDLCGHKEKYWEDHNRVISPEDRAKAEAISRRDEEERAKYRREKLAEFSVSELWAELHERMNDENYQWWEKRGIPKSWTDWYRLGYVSQRNFEHDGSSFIRPAYTIPIYDLNRNKNRTPLNMDFRIVDPPEGVGKYRPIAGLQRVPFYSRPDMESIPDVVTIVEGSIKAMCVCIWGTETEQVIGIPSVNGWAGIADKVKKCDRVYIVLDPGSEVWSKRLAKEIGKSARIVTLPVKPDDALVIYGMSKIDWKSAIRQGVKI